MALDKDQFTKVANLHSVAAAATSRQMYNLVSADTLAQVSAAGYFNAVRGYLFVGDLILVHASDGFGVLKLATVPATGNLTVTREATSGAGRVARGVAVTVTANDTLVTGLATVVAIVATLADDPVAGCQFVTASVGDQAGAPAAGSALLKTWKSTAAGDTAQIAATTFGKKVNWIAYGT